MGFIGLFLLAIQLNTQDASPVSEASTNTTLGLGVGLDYGGIGTNMLVYTNKNVGFFSGFGYAIAGLGFNAAN